MGLILNIASLPSLFSAFLAILFTLTLLVVFIMCVCHGEKDSKMQDYGIPGRLSSIVVEAPNVTEFENGGASLVGFHDGLGPNSNNVAEETEEKGDIKSRPVVDRALPAIPNGVPSSHDTDTDQMADSGSECYATVTNKAQHPILAPDHNHNGKANKLNHVESNITDDVPQSTLPPNFQSKHNKDSLMENLASTSTSTSTSGTGSSSTRTISTHTYSHVQKPHHPYARLSNQIDSDPGTDEYDESQSSDRERDKRVPRSASKANLETDMSSPSSSSIGPSSDDSKPLSSMAGQAVAGNIPSAEIPYMTPPLDDNQPSSSNPPHFDPLVVVSAEREVPYTVISVREPLERVRLQTQKLRKRQQSSNQGSSTDEPEGYYMEVPDDEQTYAEIESGPNSGESSTTYDHIEPRNPSEFPPDPPTVESLKSVAQAHSRQASIASMSSFGSGGGDGQASSSKDVRALYSVVDKNKKLSNQSAENSSNVEELYAKVQKKRAGGTMSVSGIEDVLRTDSNDPDDVFHPKNQTDNGGGGGRFALLEPRTLARRHSAEPGYAIEDITEPGYASVNNTTLIQEDDPGYERIRRQTEEESAYELILNKQFSGSGSGSSSDPGYECVSRHRLVTRKDSDLGSSEGCVDPGYERVLKLRKNLVDDFSCSDPEYECVKFLNSDPDDVVDPGYEGISRRQRKLTRKDSEADPGYETVKRVLSRNDSEVPDPGYEKVKRLRDKTTTDSDRDDDKSVVVPKTSDSETGIDADPGYEKICKNSDKTPNYFANSNSANEIDSESEENASEDLQRETFRYNEITSQETISVTTRQTNTADSGIILSGERISIRVNCTNSVAPKISPEMTPSPQNEQPIEVLSVFNNATNLMLGGAPSIHSFSSTTENSRSAAFFPTENTLSFLTTENISSATTEVVSATENGLESLDCQSNLDCYETASSGASTLSSTSRYSAAGKRENFRGPMSFS